MFLLTLKHRKTDGAYAVADQQGDRVLFLFEEEDDAERYGLMLEEDGQSHMEVIEVEDELAIRPVGCIIISMLSSHLMTL